MVKKQKLVVSICAPLATLGVAAGVTSAILLAKNKQNPSMGDCRVSFKVNEDARFVDDISPVQNVYSGTTLDRMPQPRVQSYRPNHIFTGWVDNSTKNTIPGQYKITKNATLTASFGDTTTGDYATITFKKKPDEPDVSLLGNVSVGIKHGWIFLMANRPTAEWDGNYFEYWEYLGGDGEYHKLEDTATITDDIVLYPKFSKAVTMNWHYGTGGILVRGQPTTTLAEGTQFNKFNQPQLANIDLSLVFSHWTKDEAGGQPWGPNEVVTEDNCDAYAQWKSGTRSADTNYATLSFVSNSKQKAEQETPDVIYSPSNTSVIQIGSGTGTEHQDIDVCWGTDVVKPTISTADGNYELDYWEILDDWSTTERQTTPEWISLESSFIFPKASVRSPSEKGAIQIRAWIKSSISGVTISGSQSILPESTTDYTAVVLGTEDNPYISQQVTWGLYADPECQQPVFSGATLVDGRLTVESLTEATTYYIKATSDAKPDQAAVLQVDVHMPYEDSQMIWFHDGAQWWSIAQKDGLCTDNDITAYSIDGSYNWNISKSQGFSYTLHVGRLLTSIYDQFGYKWVGFDGLIDLEESNVTKIGGSFLEGCTSFNQPLNLSKVQSIGQNFLYGCHSFDANITLVDSDGNSPLSSIGTNFLGGCASFNKPIVLPNNAINIGDAFLFGCSSFNQDLTIPANIEKIEDFFMMGCDSFTSTLTINSTKEDLWVENPNNISSTDSGADIFRIGFVVAGDGATTFTTLFPTQSTNNGYRTVRSATPIAEDWLTATEWTNAINATFGATEGSYAGLNYSVQIPSSAYGAGTVRVDGTTGGTENPHQAISAPDLGYVYIRDNSADSVYNKTWKTYEVSTSMAFEKFTSHDDNPLQRGLISFFRKGITSSDFSYNPQGEQGSRTDAHWNFNAALNKYSTKVPMPLYPKGDDEPAMNCYVDITFDANKQISMITINWDGKYVSWGFDRSKTVTINPATYSDDHRLNALTADATTPTVLATSAATTFVDSGAQHQFTIKSASNSFGSVATNETVKLWATKNGALAHLNKGGDKSYRLTWYDATGKQLGVVYPEQTTTDDYIYFKVPSSMTYPPVGTLWVFSVESAILEEPLVIHVELSHVE